MSVTPDTPTASVVIATRARAGYLSAALASIAPQAAEAAAEVTVVLDGPDTASSAVAEAHGARVITLPAAAGANAARNAGVAASSAPLIVFADDDIRAPAGWLRELIAGAARYPEHEVFGGPIRAVLEGGGPRSCGREALITTLDLGPADRDAELVWTANMAIRTRALERVGRLDERIQGRGEEEEWQTRLHAAGGRVRYLAGAGVEHHRAAADASLARLALAQYRLGRTARRNDVRKQAIPTLRAELRVLGGCLWHALRNRCPAGLVVAAHSAGRVRETLDPVPIPPADDFLSGQSGYVAGIRANARAISVDAATDALAVLRGQRARLSGAAARGPARRVLVLSIERPDVANLLAAARAELGRSRHHVTFAQTTAGDRGKFENLNQLLRAQDVASFDWLVVLDDDVRLPPDFLDRFLFLAERFGLKIAQPAHRARSHAGWDVTRRMPGTVVRETRFVEIGPVTAFAAETFDVLLPFPPLRAGWGLDAHWSALAAEHGWPIGVVDATAISHRLRPVADSYDRGDAIAEARSFLSGRPYTPAAQAGQTLTAHRSW